MYLFTKKALPTVESFFCGQYKATVTKHQKYKKFLVQLQSQEKNGGNNKHPPAQLVDVDW